MSVSIENKFCEYCTSTYVAKVSKKNIKDRRSKTQDELNETYGIRSISPDDKRVSVHLSFLETIATNKCIHCAKCLIARSSILRADMKLELEKECSVLGVLVDLLVSSYGENYLSVLVTSLPQKVLQGELLESYLEDPVFYLFEYISVREHISAWEGELMNRWYSLSSLFQGPSRQFDCDTIDHFRECKSSCISRYGDKIKEYRVEMPDITFNAKDIGDQFLQRMYEISDGDAAQLESCIRCQVNGMSI
jgi:hypothetical protein